MPKDFLPVDYHIGAVKYKSTWRFFAAFLFEWKMDFVSSDPTYQPTESEQQFRGGLMKVDETNADQFCQFMQPNELTEAELGALILKEGIEQTTLMFMIDFDSRTYVSAYFDYPFEDYAPPGWTASYGDTYAFVPENIRTLWNTGA